LIDKAGAVALARTCNVEHVDFVLGQPSADGRGILKQPQVGFEPRLSVMLGAMPREKGPAARFSPSEEQCSIRVKDIQLSSNTEVVSGGFPKWVASRNAPVLR
jgi:hypothetical protein